MTTTPMTTTLTKEPKEVNEGSLLTLKNNIVHAKPIGMYAEHKEFSTLQAYLENYNGQEHFLVWLGAWLMHNYLQQHINHNAEMLDMVRERLRKEDNEVAEELLNEMDKFNSE